jgi:hypothetical protein
MPQINKLSATDVVKGGDLFAVYVQANGDARKAAATVLLEYMQENLSFPAVDDAYVSQYASPSATAFNVAITDAVDDNTNVHLILTPTAGFAAGTITLPPNAGVVDKQEVLVNCTQQVTALTIDGNGAVAVTGAPTQLGADDFFRLKYDILTKTWYRVG